MNKANRKVLLGIAEQAKVLAADMREFNEKHDRSNTGQAVSEPAITPRLVKLQVNTTGAWRNVLDFDCADSARVLNAAENLFTGIKCTLRVIMPGDTAPLMTCTPGAGWVEWAKRFPS